MMKRFWASLRRFPRIWAWLRSFPLGLRFVRIDGSVVSRGGTIVVGRGVWLEVTGNVEAKTGHNLRLVPGDGPAVTFTPD